tara:strand:- start:828 stop:1004 length:177 start_codon:yes stop_codon:yes gene_type:complete
LVFLQKNLAFKKEFSEKDLPFSLGLLILKSKGDKVLILFGSKSLISLNFPLLFDPISS